MPKSKTLKSIFLLFLITVLVTACSPGVDANLPNSETQAVLAAFETLTAMPSPTPNIAATNTPEPATATPTTEPTATATATQAPVASGPTGFPDNVNPLTGLFVSDPAILQRSPVFIKVANWPAEGRPHNGLSSADIVFEYYIGVGANRFMAVYYGQDSEKVGPVRSGRMVDGQLVPMYSGILGFVSADERVWAVLNQHIEASRLIIPASDTCSAICDDGRGVVYSTFANTAEMIKVATTRGISMAKPNLDGMRFDPAAPGGGQPGTDVVVQYNIYDIGEWKYDASSGKYLRWIEDSDGDANITMVELPDANTGQQLAFSNVVVLFASYTEYASTLHDITITANTTGQRAIIYRDGQAYDVFWKSVGANAPIQFFTADGQPFAMKPGNTWMAVMGLNTALSQPETGKWDFVFNLP